MYKKVKVIRPEKGNNIDKIVVEDIIAPKNDTQYFEIRETGDLAGLGLYLGNIDDDDFKWVIYEDNDRAAVLLQVKA